MAKSGRRRGSKSRGWGVPFPKVARKPGNWSQASHGTRTDADLEHLVQEWTARYTERVRAHRLLGVSMGTPLDEVEESHHRRVAVLAPGDPRRWELDQALQLVLATAETGGAERPSGAPLPDDSLPDVAAVAWAGGDPGAGSGALDEELEPEVDHADADRAEAP